MIILVVELEFVFFVGIIVSCVSFYNVEEIICKDIWVGDVVVVEKVGKIIFYIVCVEIFECDGDFFKYVFLIVCLSCFVLFV